MIKLHKCDICGKEFADGNDKHGIPNGVGFRMSDGRVVTVCSDCIMHGDHNETVRIVRGDKNAQ